MKTTSVSYTHLDVYKRQVLSGAYFGDKMSPLSDTTNLAPAMAGTDVITHVKAMILPTAITYGITLVFFGVLGACLLYTSRCV